MKLNDARTNPAGAGDPPQQDRYDFRITEDGHAVEYLNTKTDTWIQVLTAPDRDTLVDAFLREFRDVRFATKVIGYDRGEELVGSDYTHGTYAAFS